MGNELGFENAQQRLDNREVDLLAEPTCVAFVQCRHHGECESEAGDAITKSKRWQQRWLVGRSVTKGEAGHDLGHGPKAWLVRHRAVTPKTAEVRDDESGVVFAQRFVAESPTFHRARTKILDDHIRPRSQRLKDLLALRRTKIEGEALLIAAEHQPPQRCPVELIAVSSRGVASLRMLDLDDLRSIIAEQHRSKGRGDDGGDVQNSNALKWPRSRRT